MHQVSGEDADARFSLEHGFRIRLSPGSLSYRNGNGIILHLAEYSLISGYLSEAGSQRCWPNPDTTLKNMAGLLAMFQLDA